jgi:hypothetical protein
MEKYIVDRDGNPVEVIIPINDYQKLLNALEELEGIRDLVKKGAEKDNGKK